MMDRDHGEYGSSEDSVLHLLSLKPYTSSTVYCTLYPNSPNLGLLGFSTRGRYSQRSENDRLRRLT